MVLGNGHLVVVYNDDKVGAKLVCVIQTLQRFAAGQGTIADNRNYVLGAAAEIAPLCKSACEAHGSGCVTHREMIVLALMLAGVSGNVVVPGFVKERVISACEHFVAVGLVRYVEHQLVLRGVENVMERDHRLHHAKVRAAVTAVYAQLLYKRGAHFLRELLHLIRAELLYVRRGIDFLKIHVFSSILFRICPVIS